MMQPMAVVTIGGLSYATLMTLFVVPVLYDLFNGKNMKAREIEMMKEAAGMKREGFDGDTPALPGNGAAAPKAPVRAEAEAAGPDAAARAEAKAETGAPIPDEVAARKARRVKVKF